MAGTSPPSKRPRIEFADLFVVNVGEASKPYRLPTKTFTMRSNFFKAALSSKWRTEDSAIDLKDVQIDHFETYVHCVICDEVDLIATPDTEAKTLAKLVDLYVLSDRMLDPETTNLVMDNLVRTVGESDYLPSDDLLSRIYRLATSGSPLRKLAVDWALHEWNEQPNDGKPEDNLPSELLTDLFREFRRLKNGNQNGKRTVDKVFALRADKRQKCCYHQHPEDSPKCK
ncbi:hypothetical protein B0A48_01363 [Cryoendolithus antarcticus]|uniref:BTB domain-containing protein n=1 Tax=Cryoendolithus antarcticus TaxID=1507870 RepID=A0A1V8TSX7_9PEZI|nr:hypothetical protein B0A48_01363 [Cryoendolithus antarcticus]